MPSSSDQCFTQINEQHSPDPHKMAALSFAIVGKDNEPLYMKEFREVGFPQEIDDAILFHLEPGPRASSSTRDWDCSVRHQFILHAALDRLEQLAALPPGFGWKQSFTAHGMEGCFVGLLTPVEDMRVYGYVTTSQIKLILVVEDEAVPDIQKNVDEEIKTLLGKIHDLYVADLMNPFKAIGTPIVSNRFEEGLQRYVAAFNQTDGII